MIPKKGLIGCALPVSTSGSVDCSFVMGSGCTKGLLGHSTFRRKFPEEKDQQTIRMLGAAPMVWNMQCLWSELPDQDCTRCAWLLYTWEAAVS